MIVCTIVNTMVKEKSKAHTYLFLTLNQTIVKDDEEQFLLPFDQKVFKIMTTNLLNVYITTLLKITSLKEFAVDMFHLW